MKGRARKTGEVRHGEVRHDVTHEGKGKESVAGVVFLNMLFTKSGTSIFM